MPTRLLSPLLIAAIGCGSQVTVEPSSDEPSGSTTGGNAQTGGAGGQGGTPAQGGAGGTGTDAIVWAKGFPATEAEIADVAVGADGDWYIGGPHDGVLNLDGAVVDSNANNLYLARLSTDGLGKWARTFPGFSEQTVLGLDVLGDDAFLCGYVAAEMDLGTTILTTDINRLFVARFDGQGSTVSGAIVDSQTPGFADNCVVEATGRFVVALRGVFQPEEPVIARKVEPDGSSTWEVTNEAPPGSFGMAAARAAVGPADETYMFWSASWPGLDLPGPTEPVPWYDGLLAAFDESGAVTWSATPTLKGPFTISASAKGVLLAGSMEVANPIWEATARLYSPSGEVLWTAPLRPNEEVSASIVADSGRAWIAGPREEPQLGGWVTELSPSGETVGQVDLGPYTRPTAMAQIDEVTVLVAGGYSDDTEIDGVAMAGTGIFLAVIRSE